MNTIQENESLSDLTHPPHSLSLFNQKTTTGTGAEKYPWCTPQLLPTRSNSSCSQHQPRKKASRIPTSTTLLIPRFPYGSGGAVFQRTKAKEGKGKAWKSKKQRYLYARSQQTKSSLPHRFWEKPQLAFPLSFYNPLQPCCAETPCHNLITSGYLKAFWGRGWATILFLFFCFLGSKKKTSQCRIQVFW